MLGKQLDATFVLMADAKYEELSVQKQLYEVVGWSSPQPSFMSRMIVLRGRSAHAGRAEYSVSESMKRLWAMTVDKPHTPTKRRAYMIVFMGIYRV
jgi:hypothetical protein